MATAKQKKAQDEGKVASYTVLARLDHDGTAYTAGDSITLDADTASGLLAINVIEPSTD